MEHFAIPDDEDAFSTIIDQVKRGHQVQLLRKGQPLAVVVPFQRDVETSQGDIVNAYYKFREKFDLANFDFDFQESLKSSRYRDRDSGREFEW